MISVAYRWQDVGGDLDGRAVLVIDTLRATTTMATILHNGADAVFPCGDLAEAYALKEGDPSLILGGERDNRPPPGFDGGNSPFDYPPDRVAGRRVVLTTTNGTQAVERVRTAPWVGCAALVNAEAAAARQRQTDRSGLVVCAGTQGHLSLEDVLAAGAIVAEWPQAAWTDSARMAFWVYDRFRHNLYAGLTQADHAHALMEGGYVRDLEYAAQLNALAVVPVRGPDGWFAAG